MWVRKRNADKGRCGVRMQALEKAQWARIIQIECVCSVWWMSWRRWTAQRTFSSLFHTCASPGLDIDIVFLPPGNERVVDSSSSFVSISAAGTLVDFNPYPVAKAEKQVLLLQVLLLHVLLWPVLLLQVLLYAFWLVALLWTLARQRQLSGTLRPILTQLWTVWVLSGTRTWTNAMET